MATFIMRAYDPAGEAFEQWESTSYDTSGTDYAGVPAFGTLINIHAAYIIADAGGGGTGFTTNSGFEVIATDAEASDYGVADIITLGAIALTTHTGFDNDQTELFKVS